MQLKILNERREEKIRKISQRLYKNGDGESSSLSLMSFVSSFVSGSSVS
jgi:hypothetical protein